MNIEDYISSGILECYVLGQLSRTESAKVEELARQYPEIRKEIDGIEESLEHYASSHAITPPEGIKEKILSEINARQPSPETGKVVEIYKSNKTLNYLAAASVVLALLLGSGTLYFYQKYNELNMEITALRQESERTASTYQAADKKFQEDLKSKEDLLSLLRDTSTNAVILKGLPISPASSALVFWNKNNHTVVIDVKNLPAPPSDKQYQLWALDNGTPFDAGVFETNSGNLQKVKKIFSAQAFAVTLENKGGSPSPTLDQMYLMGNI